MDNTFLVLKAIAIIGLIAGYVVATMGFWMRNSEGGILGFFAWLLTSVILPAIGVALYMDLVA